MLSESTTWGYLIGDFAEKLQEELKPQVDREVDFDLAAELNRVIRALEDLSSRLQDM